jgi:hypothetical protein
VSGELEQLAYESRVAKLLLRGEAVLRRKRSIDDVAIESKPEPVR